MRRKTIIAAAAAALALAAGGVAYAAASGQHTPKLATYAAADDTPISTSSTAFAGTDPTLTVNVPHNAKSVTFILEGYALQPPAGNTGGELGVSIDGGSAVGRMTGGSTPLTWISGNDVTDVLGHALAPGKHTFTVQVASLSGVPVTVTKRFLEVQIEK